MLKPSDPAWAELVAEIKAAVSSRGDDGYAFTSLHRTEQWDFFTTSGFYSPYMDRGMTEAQVTTIIRNALEGKPQEKWLDGVFEGQALVNQKIASFKAMVEERKNRPANYVFDEMDGSLQSWANLSAAAKLQYIASDAAYHDVPFEPFAQAVKDAIGDAGQAALRVVLEGQKELHAIAKLLPDDGRTEPTPLVEQVKEMLDYVSALDTQEKDRRQGREKLFEGISDVLDGKPPQAWSDAAKALRDILRGNVKKPDSVQTQERGGREM